MNVSSRTRKWTPIVLRLAIASMFVFAAVPKLADPASFAIEIDNYRVLPELLVGPLSVIVPVLELVVAAALLSGVHARGAALVAGGMLLTFAGAMIQAMARGIDLDCGCFGSALEMRVSGFTVARNLVLALVCVPIVWAKSRDVS
jgi:uncharacterized membrane protein YphA (DoxX/SURF4 family)